METSAKTNENVQDGDGSSPRLARICSTDRRRPVGREARRGGRRSRAGRQARGRGGEPGRVLLLSLGERRRRGGRAPGSALCGLFAREACGTGQPRASHARLRGPVHPGWRGPSSQLEAREASEAPLPNALDTL
ncbi:unnamed protein product [Prorocentrum cordatum]|uniref:Uncharacterized protein n=1 Tax=Prorocentrum cordatum TaxID=2364126 RepID=A0ABN9WJ27_9DINO|nr:unnamed protein product [Polarella glacialis]